MALEVYPPDRVPTEAEIQALEQQLGFQLPERFRAMLPLLNGTSPEPHVLKLGGPEDHWIHEFEKIENIAEYKLGLEIWHPSPLHLVPFAMDGCGNAFCIAVADGPERGAIYFIEHEIEGDESIERIADDFDAMLRSAQPEEIDPNEPPPVPSPYVWARPGAMEMIKEQERCRKERRLRQKPNVFPPPTEDQG